MNTTAISFDISGLADFQQRVLESSFNQPVLVDFWAQWCAPCKALLPILEKITAEFRGQLHLARIDCDAEQNIVAQFGIRSLPTVVLFKDGQPVDGFSGAQPESVIRELLQAHLPPPPEADEDPLQQAQALFNEGQFAEAQNLLARLLAEDSHNAAANILYARCLAERDELGQAQRILDNITDDAHKKERAAALATLAFLKQSKELPEAALLKSRLAQNPADDEAAMQLAIHQLARGQYETAVSALFSLFLKKPKPAENPAHKILLQVFELLDSDHPLVVDYRRKLYQALY